MNNSIRVDALEWWNALEDIDKRFEVILWRSKTFDFRREWLYPLIAASDSLIEKIYRELIMEENFN